MATAVQKPQIDASPEFAAFRDRILAFYFKAFESLSPEERAQAAQPTEKVFRRAWLLFCLATARQIIPSQVVPSMEGGIGICFASDEKYADIECLNSNEVLGVVTDRRDIVDVFEVSLADAKAVEDAISRIGDFIGYTQEAVHTAR